MPKVAHLTDRKKTMKGLQDRVAAYEEQISRMKHMYEKIREQHVALQEEYQMVVNLNGNLTNSFNAALHTVITLKNKLEKYEPAEVLTPNITEVPATPENVEKVFTGE